MFEINVGILIHNHLSWKSHTSPISKIVSKYNGIIRKIRSYLNQDSLQTLYNTLVLPYLSYCTLVWGDNLESLFILQIKVIRTCTNSLWLEHTTPIFIALKTLKIRDLYITNSWFICLDITATYYPFRSPFNLVYQPIGYSQLQHATCFQFSYCSNKYKTGRK